MAILSLLINHAVRKKSLERIEAREMNFMEALKKHDLEAHQKSETLPESQ